MLEAIRNLGILRMMDELTEFQKDCEISPLDSVEAFLKARKESIENGTYVKFQFEPLNYEDIGIFSIDTNGRIVFKIEKVLDDSTRYLFLKTASQGTYLTPTWKDSQSKLKKTVDKYIKDETSNDSDWLKSVVKIFKSDSIEIEEQDQQGNLIKKPFYEVVDWAKKSKKIKIFSIRIDDKYNAEIKELRDFAFAAKSKAIYQTDKAKSFSTPGVSCSLCSQYGELFSNVLSGVGINIGNVDKQVFFPGVNSENAGKAFPICAPCAEALYSAKFHVFHNSSELRQDISGHRTLLIPHLVKSDNTRDSLNQIKSMLTLVKKDVKGAARRERSILRELSENKSIATITIIIGNVSGQSIEDIRKVIPEILPSRFSEVSNAIDDINKKHNIYTAEHPWVLEQTPLNGNLSIIRDVLGIPRYSEPIKGKRKPFKASLVDSLDILSAIFLRIDYPMKNLLEEFSSKLSYDLLGAQSDKEAVYSIRTNISKMIYLLLFLERLDVIKMNAGQNFVSKYLEKHKGLQQLNSFLSNEAKGLDTKEKEYAFLVGLLLGKLISIQLAKQISANALKWLNGLQVSQQDLKDIFVKTRNKLDDYSTPKTAWSDEMRGVSEAISALGADIDKWSMSRKEIAYYLSLGQSLSGYYLPSKVKYEESESGD